MDHFSRNNWQSHVGKPSVRVASSGSPRKNPNLVLDPLLDLVMTLDEMENRIEDFTEENLLFEQINAYIEKLKNMSDAKDHFQVDIPIQVLDRLDNDTNNNPEKFSVELLQRCRSNFLQVRTKTEGLKLLKEGINDWRIHDEKNGKTL